MTSPCAVISYCAYWHLCALCDARGVTTFQRRDITVVIAMLLCELLLYHFAIKHKQISNF